MTEPKPVLVFAVVLGRLLLCRRVGEASSLPPAGERRYPACSC